MPSIAQAINAVPSNPQSLRQLLDAILVDNTELRTELAAAIADLATIRTAFNVAIAKLNLDAGVTDVNYAAAAALTAATPAALTVTS
jgi:hypothetical protein